MERQDDPEERRIPARAIQVGRLAHFARDALQRRQEDDHHKAGPLPDAGDHDRGERELRVVEPVGGMDPGEIEQVGDHAHLP